MSDRPVPSVISVSLAAAVTASLLFASPSPAAAKAPEKTLPEKKLAAAKPRPGSGEGSEVQSGSADQASKTAASLKIPAQGSAANEKASAADAVGVENGFPLSKGNYWTYKGTVKYQKQGFEKVFEKAASIKMEVTDVIGRDGIFAAKIKGYPLELAGFDERASERGNYLLVRAGSGSYYLLGESAIGEALKKIGDPDDVLHELVDESDLIIDLPLAKGKVFGEAEQVTRTDGKYCWRVDECVDTDLSAVKGAGMAATKEFWLFHSTNPDTQKVGFVPGIGITSYSYRHNGTVMEFDVKLAECGLGGGTDKKREKPGAGATRKTKSDETE